MQYYLRQLSEVSLPMHTYIHTSPKKAKSNQFEVSADLHTFYFMQYQQQQMKKTGGFSTDSATRELLRYAMRYYEPVQS